MKYVFFLKDGSYLELDVPQKEAESIARHLPIEQFDFFMTRDKALDLGILPQFEALDATE